MKIVWVEGEKITKVDKTETEYIDCRSHYMLTIRKNNDVETERKIHAVLYSSTVAGDFFFADQPVVPRITGVVQEAINKAGKVKVKWDEDKFS